MLSAQPEKYGTVEIPKKYGSATHRPTKYYLLALIAAIGVISMVGAFVHLSGDAKLNAPFSRAMINTHQGKPDAVFCASYDKTIGITRNQQLVTVPYAQNMRVSFYTKITGSAFGNVLQLGGQDDDEWPGIFFNRGQPDNHLLFTFAKEGQTKTEVEIVEITHNTDLLVQVEINNLNAKIYLDGKLEREVTIPAELKPAAGTTIPVFAGANFQNAAGGFIRDLEVCSSYGTLPSVRPSCQREFGPFTLIKDQQIMTVDIFDNFDLTFKVTIAPGSANGDIFQIGHNNDNAVPRMHWQTNQHVQLVFDSPQGGGWAPNVNSGIAPGSEAVIKLEVRQYAVKYYVDGVHKYSGTMPWHAKYTGHQLPVYTAVTSNPATGSIREVEICNL